MKGSDLAGKTGIPLPTHETPRTATIVTRATRRSEGEDDIGTARMRTYHSHGVGISKSERSRALCGRNMFNSTLDSAMRKPWFRTTYNTIALRFRELRQCVSTKLHATQEVLEEPSGVG
ncbi:hypothetical protein Tco_0837972 [Tanacetum coccineum]